MMFSIEINGTFLYQLLVNLQHTQKTDPADPHILLMRNFKKA